jgi:hypothetical protein
MIYWPDEKKIPFILEAVFIPLHFPADGILKIKITSCSCVLFSVFGINRYFSFPGIKSGFADFLREFV